MNNNNDSIMSSQVFSLVINVIIGLDILSLPGLLAETVGPDAMWVLVIGCILFLINLWIVIKIITMNPRKNIIEIGDNVVFKYFGTFIAIIFLVYSMLQMSLQIRAFADIVKNFLLFNTPLEIIMISYLFAVMYVARSGIESIARMSGIILVFSLIPMLVTMIFAIPDLDITTFLPLFRSKYPQIQKGVILSMLTFRGFEFLLIFGVFIKDPHELKKNVMRSGILISCIYIFVVFVTISRFGVIQTRLLLWSVLTLFKSISLPSGLLQNLEVIIMSTWVTSVLLSTGILLFSVAYLTAIITKSKEFNFWVIAFVPITIMIALIPQNIAQVYDWGGWVGHTFGIAGSIIIPVILFIMSYIRKRRKGKNA